MKKIRSLLLSMLVACVLLFASIGFAQGWWTANANATYTNIKVTGSVYNGFPRPIYCIGRVVGGTYYGMTYWSSFEAVIPPGRYAYAYVYTNPRDPFVGADANIQCKF